MNMRTANSQVQELFKDGEFENLLESARMNASSDWEESFVADMKTRFDQYGKRMYISSSQREHIERIANDD